MSHQPGFTLRNVGSGPDPLPFGDVAGANDFALLLFQRDFFCVECRKQIQAVADEYEAFRERNAEVVSIVPEPAEKLRGWQEEYELPYPLCADLEKRVSGAFGQPVRFGPLGKLSDFFGRMPMAVLVDCRPEEPSVVYTHEGSSTWDRPSVSDLLGEIDRRL